MPLIFCSAIYQIGEQCCVLLLNGGGVQACCYCRKLLMIGSSSAIEVAVLSQTNDVCYIHCIVHCVLCVYAELGEVEP